MQISRASSPTSALTLSILTVGAGVLPAVGASQESVPRLEPVGGVAGCVMCEGLAALGSVAGVALLPDGRLAVLDQTEPMVRIFDSGGAPVAAFGREGEGPGELRTPAGLAATRDGRLVVADLTQRSITVFDTAGAVLGSRPVESTVADLSGSPDGSKIIYQQAEWGTMSAGVHLLDSSSGPDSLRGIGAPLPTTRGRLLDERGEAASLGLFTTAVGPRGQVAAGTGWNYHVVVLSADGDVLHEMRREIARVERTPEELAELESRRRSFPGAGGDHPEAGAPRSRVEVDPLHPHFYHQSLAYDGDGRLWISTPRGGPDRTVFDVFGPDGEYLGETTVDAPVRQITIRSGTLAGVVRDPATGVETVRRWAIRSTTRWMRAVLTCTIEP